MSKRMQNDTTHSLQGIYQSQQDHKHDSLIDDIPTFNGKPELYFGWILKIENIATVTKQNPKDLALVKAQDSYKMF